MKPTLQINRSSHLGEPRSTELKNDKSRTTDWSLHSSSPVMGVSTASFGNQSSFGSTPRLWALSQGFIEAEGKREYRLEALLFAFVAALAAWPIGFAFYMASETVR